MKSDIMGKNKNNQPIWGSRMKKSASSLFRKVDFCKKKLNLRKKYDIIYARFFMHAINENEQKKFFNNIKKISKKKSKIFFEFRTINDPLMIKGKKISVNESYYGHYRRFINTTKFRNDLNKNNFKITFFKESKKFALYKNQKPSICRIIAEKTH